MIRIQLSTLILGFLCISFVHAQTLSYQGVARNAAGAPLANTSIAIRLSIKDAQENGNTLYTETKSVTTNGFGLYSISINDGNGSRAGNFATIDWSQQRFIQTETDPENGTAFADLGTAPLHSVPQALSAATLNGIPQPKEGYYIEYKNSEWVQKPKPRKYSARGVGLNPSPTLNFVGPTCTITIAEDNPIVTLSVTKSFGSSAANGGIGLNIALGFKKVGESDAVSPTSFMGSVGINGHRVARGTRIPMTLSSSYQTEFKAGEQYIIGMVAYSLTNSGSWNDNGDGIMFAEVSY